MCDRAMRRVLYISLLLLCFIPASLYAQDVKIKQLNFLRGQSVINPVVVDSVLYFSSDMNSDFLVRYINELGKDLYHVYKVPLKNRKPSGSVEPLMPNANKKLNQVAVAFDTRGKAYVTENNVAIDSRRGRVLSVKSYSDLSAVEGVVSVAHNGNSSNAYVAFAPDGSFMVFASDQKGGQGSSDLYYCERKSKGWSKPQNMGSMVNTAGAETTPFIHPSGKIYFASNGHSDSKRLDLYYTYRTPAGFAKPERVDSDINSNADDYGLFISENEEWGFVTSNRNGKDRLYYFTQEFPVFPNATEFEEDNFCYEFTEESAQYYDAEQYDFKWAFSDGGVEMGLEVEHCFADAGDYDIKLSVLDKVSKEEMFNIAEYSLELVHAEQLYIDGPETIKAGREVVFNADASYVTSFEPKYFYWTISNGQKIKGKKVKVRFSKPGTYRVEVGTMNEEDKSQYVATYIMVNVE